MSLWRVEAGRLILGPLHAGQSRAWDSARRFVAIISGTQSGKTTFAPWWLVREIEARGAGDYLAVTANFPLYDRKLLPEMLTTFQHVLKRGRYWAGHGIIELADPSGKFLASRAHDRMWGRIILCAATAPAGLEAATAKAAIFDEAGMDECALETWEAIQRRLSIEQGRCLISTTPYNLGWLKTEVWDRWQAGDPDIDVIQHPSWWNPAFPRAEYDRMKARMQGWRFAMMYDGEFATPAGLIYGAFSHAPWPEGNLWTEEDVPDPDWPHVVGLDPGGANLATVFLAHDRDRDVWIVYDESLTGGITTPEHVARVSTALAGCRDVVAVGGSRGEEQVRRDWTVAGLRVRPPAIWDVESGIDRVLAMIGGAGGPRRLAVMPHCRGLLDEIGSYRRKLDDRGNPTEEILDKRAFHRLDALRYAVTLIATPTPGARYIRLAR